MSVTKPVNYRQSIAKMRQIVQTYYIKLFLYKRIVLLGWSVNCLIILNH